MHKHPDLCQAPRCRRPAEVYDHETGGLCEEHSANLSDSRYHAFLARLKEVDG